MVRLYYIAHNCFAESCCKQAQLLATRAQSLTPFEQFAGVFREALVGNQPDLRTTEAEPFGHVLEPIAPRACHLDVDFQFRLDIGGEPDHLLCVGAVVFFADLPHVAEEGCTTGEMDGLRQFEKLGFGCESRNDSVALSAFVLVPETLDR